MRKNNKALFIVAIVIVTFAVIGLIKTKIAVNESAAALAETASNDLGVPTEVIEVTSAILNEKISYIGTIAGENSVMVSPKITSQLNQLNFIEGDAIKKGDVIAELDDSQFRAKLNSTLQKIETMEVNYSFLNSELENYYQSNPAVKKIATLEKNHDYLNDQVEKYKTLLEHGAISEDSYNKAKHEKDMLALQLEELNAVSKQTYNKLEHERDITQMQLKELSALTDELKLNLQEANVKAPISGRIRMIHYSTGDLVMTGKPVATIDDMENLIVKVNMGELDLAKINIGTKAIINILSNESEIEAVVTNILPSVNPTTRIGEVEVSLTLENGINIMIGSSSQVDFIINKLEEKIVIDTANIKTLEDKKIVYVFKDGHIYEKEIKTGRVVGDKVQVLEGLEVGEKIASKNINALYNGAKVYEFQGANN